MVKIVSDDYHRIAYMFKDVLRLIETYPHRAKPMIAALSIAVLHTIERLETTNDD